MINLELAGEPSLGKCVIFNEFCAGMKVVQEA